MTGWGVSDDHVVVGRRIRQARQELGLTQTELATRIGISAEVLDSFETGRADPSGTLAQIAEATGRPVPWYTSPNEYDLVGGVYGAGLPAELRKRLAESSGRPPWADTEVAEQEGAAALGERGSRPGNGGASARGDDNPDLASPAEDLPGELKALAQKLQQELRAVSAVELEAKPAEELEDVDASRSHEVELARRVAQLEADVRVAEERVAEAAARLDRAETKLETVRSRERSLAEELDLGKAGLSRRAAELDRREAAVAEAEAELEHRRRTLADVERHAPALAPPEGDLRTREDQLSTGDDGSPPAREAGHLAVAPDHGYRLVARRGAVPNPGAIVELDGTQYRCLRIQASPFLGDDRPCAVLELLPPTPQRERSRAPE